MANIQIISTETIKPSSPTPETHRYLLLSLLDQIAPTVHFPIILFYPPEQTAGKSSRLKKSLSEILTRFYPLAGRIMDDPQGLGYLHVDCNDEGVAFHEARADVELSRFLQQPGSNMLLLPSVPSSSIPLLIQLTVFKCGGSAIGVIISHKIGDGTSLSTFITSWAEASRTGDDLYKPVSPRFGFTEIFPPRSMNKPLVQTAPPEFKDIPVFKDKPTSKRLVLEPSKIAALKEKACARAGFVPTRVEAVTALIWRCALRARGEKGSGMKPAILHAVNIRSRMDPPLPECSIGNLTIPAFVTGDTIGDDCDSYRVGYLEARLREAFGKVKGELMREALEEDSELLVDGSSWNLYNHKWEERGFDYMTFTSWAGFKLYGCDFGWGKPDSLGFVTVPVKNVVALFPTNNGGVEVLVTLAEEEMEKFEQDQEIKEFVSCSK